MASRKHHAAALALAAAVLLPLSSQASPFALAHAAEIESSKPSAAPTLGRQYSHLPAANSLHSSFNPYAMDAPIYHDSERWDWLSYPEKVVPGGQIINIDTGGQCSTGWIVSQKQRYFILTAGHCGRVYDRFAIRDRNGNSAVIGQMVERKNLSNNSSGDYALIELSTLQYVDPRLPGHNQVPGWYGVQWLKQNHPRTVCHLGYRTGESCGQYLGVDDLGYIHFRGIVDHGDSGDPVYVMIKGTPLCGRYYLLGTADKRHGCCCTTHPDRHATLGSYPPRLAATVAAMLKIAACRIMALAPTKAHQHK